MATRAKLNEHPEGAGKRRAGQQRLTRRALTLYERYGQPLEAEHGGEYVAISLNGGVVLAPTLVEALRDGAAKLGPGNFVFKLGERLVGVWK